MKNLTQVLTESASYIGNITGDKNILTLNGFRNIIGDHSARQELVHRLTEGFSADHREVLSGLMERTLDEAVLQESFGTLSPFQALSLPLLRTLWPYNSIKDGIQTIVATAPTFMLTLKKYYLVKRTGNTVERFALPAHSAMLADNPHGERVSKTYTAWTANNGVVNTYVTENFGGELTSDVELVNLAVTIGSEVYGVSIPKHGWNTGKNIVVTFNNELFAKVRKGDDTDFAHYDYSLSGTLVLFPELLSGDVNIMAALTTKISAAYDTGGTVPTADSVSTVQVTVRASLTEKWQENNLSFEFQTESFSVTIPDGKHVSAPVPAELVQDIKSLYQLDAASELSNGMKMLYADAFDIEGLKYFEETIESAYPGQLDAARTLTYGTANNDVVTPIKVFDTLPQIGYMGDHVQWRSNTMKDLLRQITTILEKEWYIKYGKISLFANPLAADMLHGVDWVFEQGDVAEEEIMADYSVGTFRALGKAYKLISSQHVPEDIVYVLLTPSEDDVMTLRYYPYYFGLETGAGYRDPLHPNVPAVSFIRRHKFEKLIPAIGALVIKNIGGSPQYGGFRYTT